MGEGHLDTWEGGNTVNEWRRWTGGQLGGGKRGGCPGEVQAGGVRKNRCVYGLRGEPRGCWGEVGALEGVRRVCGVGAGKLRKDRCVGWGQVTLC